MPKTTTSSSSRKPTTSKPKPKKQISEGVDMEDEDLQQVEQDQASEAEEEEEEGGETGNDATVIAETQFEARGTTKSASNTNSSSSKGKKATSSTTAPKKAVAKPSTSTNSVGSKRKAKDELTRESEAASEDEEASDEQLTPREKKLKLKLEAREKALAEVTAQFEKLKDLRQTRAEESEIRLKAIADERQTAATNTIATYKKEADNLRAENSSLQTTAYASPRSKAAQAVDRKVQELERTQSDTLAKLEEFEKEAEEREKYWQKKLENELREREKSWNAEKQQLSTDLETVQNDYATEVAHSKSLQAKLKSIGPTSSSSSLPAATSTVPSTASTGSSASAAKLAQVTEERDLAIRKLQLNEDLTGFMVNSVRGTDEPSYVCSLTDCWGTEEKSLNFKIIFYRDETVGYTPDLDPQRDVLLSQLLPPEFQSYVRFNAEHCGEWFKKLYTAVNKRK
ncbi:hypothetical protein JCM3765_006521 [Sporobolomyces pararoseus]